jgi:hypothetical protein
VVVNGSGDGGVREELAAGMINALGCSCRTSVRNL